VRAFVPGNYAWFLAEDGSNAADSHTMGMDCSSFDPHSGFHIDGEIALFPGLCSLLFHFAIHYYTNLTRIVCIHPPTRLLFAVIVFLCRLFFSGFVTPVDSSVFRIRSRCIFADLCNRLFRLLIGGLCSMFFLSGFCR
jgi:hypothetical protein